MKKLLTAAFLTVAMSASAYAANLTADQIQDELIGKRISFVLADGVTKGSVRYKKNGSATVSIKKPNRFKDKGKWWLKGNSLCNQWNEIRGGAPRCSTFKQVKKKEFVSNTGATLKTGF